MIYLIKGRFEVKSSEKSSLGPAFDPNTFNPSQYYSEDMVPRSGIGLARRLSSSDSVFDGLPGVKISRPRYGEPSSSKCKQFGNQRAHSGRDPWTKTVGPGVLDQDRTR